MRLWRQLQRVVWAVGITSVVLLATMECLYRATFTRLPPRTVPAQVVSAQGTEAAAIPLLRRMYPWAILRALTAFLRARKGQASPLERFQVPGRAPMEWTWMPRRQPLPQGLRGLSGSAFC
jgi:hypothetical protein